MNREPTLFDLHEPGRPSAAVPLSHRDDPVTSYLAADRLRRSGRHLSQKRRVLEALRRCDGATSGELGASLGKDWLYAARRLTEPERDGLARKGDIRPCRIKGSKCVTWWLTEPPSPSVSGGDHG
jgi:hypothetical protein